MISQKKLNEIKSKLEECGDGVFEFETKDIEALLVSFEELSEKSKEIQRCLRQQLLYQTVLKFQ